MLKSAALSVALLALLLRAAVPEGWMPAKAASAPLMPCPGIMTMPMTPSHHGAPLRKQDGHTTICIFAATAHFGSVPVPAPLAAPAGAVERIAPLPSAVVFVSKSLYRPNTARAPPLSI
ncbi:MAG: hypothetical protein JO261_05485 [Alphaproteobacteria bacterium]|nr:hypothetical protein [Alphaproteobacteria bacterium]MBV9693134.1 hypothetical protein [Alphaproteobacteria bacterium]